MQTKQKPATRGRKKGKWNIDNKLCREVINHPNTMKLQLLYI